MRSYMRYWCDAFRLPDWTMPQLDNFELPGIGACAVAHPGRPRGRLVVPHMGNWDHIGALCAHHIAPVNTVAEKLEPEQLYTAFVDFRTSLGMRIHGLGDSGGVPDAAGRPGGRGSGRTAGRP